MRTDSISSHNNHLGEQVMNMNIFIAVALSAVASIATAQPLTGKLVQIDTGEESASTALTNGAVFKIGAVSYRLEIGQDADNLLLEELNREGIPVRINDLPAKEAFTMLTHLSGTTIVCARDVEKDLKVSINTQDASMMQILDQICFQIDAIATVSQGTVWITRKAD
jgi:hypothetical protein